MNIMGVVKVEITVAPNGTIKNAKLIAGIRYWRTRLWMRFGNGVTKRARKSPRGLWNFVLIRISKFMVPFGLQQTARKAEA